MSEKPNVKIVYRRLRKRLDSMPVGAPRSRELYEILSILFSEEEADIGARMPQKPSTVDKIAKFSGLDSSTLQSKLEKMADKGLVLDFTNSENGKTYYLLAPTVVGFFEFSLMTHREDIDQKRLAGLYQKYMFEEHTFAHSAFRARTQFGRAMVHETALAPEQMKTLLPYESATSFIENAKTFSLTTCYCRNKGVLTEHECSFSLEVCMSLDMSADYLMRHKLARPSSKTELLEKLASCRELGLVQMGDNIKQEPGFICNCCGCHCGVLAGWNKHGIPAPMMTSNFIAHVDAAACRGCGLCKARCPIDAISLKDSKRDDGKTVKHAGVDQDICLGCGVCHAACKFDALSMYPRRQRVITPETTIERVAAMSLERGTLGNLLFDDPNRLDHKFLRGFMTAVLNMPPARQIMLNDTLRSRCLNFLMDAVSKSANLKKPQPSNVE